MHNTKKYLHRVWANKGSRVSIVLLIAIVFFSRIKSFPRNLCSRSSKNFSSDSKLETRSSKLDSRCSKIETRNSSLETLSSILENFENRESSFESRLSTYLWAVLYFRENEFLCKVEIVLRFHKVKNFLFLFIFVHLCVITWDDVVSQRLKFGGAFLWFSWESKIALFF